MYDFGLKQGKKAGTLCKLEIKCSEVLINPLTFAQLDGVAKKDLLICVSIWEDEDIKAGESKFVLHGDNLERYFSS